MRETLLGKLMLLLVSATPEDVRKRVGGVIEQLSKRGPEKRAFGEHLRTHLSIGFECLYSRPEGRIWS